MSHALSDAPVHKVTRVIQSLGFVYVRTKGSHAIYRHPDGRAAVIPQHSTIKRGTSPPQQAFLLGRRQIGHDGLQFGDRPCDQCTIHPPLVLSEVEPAVGDTVLQPTPSGEQSLVWAAFAARAAHQPDLAAILGAIDQAVHVDLANRLAVARYSDPLALADALLAVADGLALRIPLRPPNNSRLC